jgi:hypothetical protein
MDVFGNQATKLPVLDNATEIYQCPEAASVTVDSVADVTAQAQIAVTQTQITSITFCHWGSSTGTAHFVNLWLMPLSTDAKPTRNGGGNAQNANLLLYNYPIDGTETVTFNFGLMLKPGNTLWAECQLQEEITATVNYIEIS